MAAKKTTAKKTTTAPKKKYRVTDDTFIAFTSQGEIELPLDIPVKAFRHFQDIVDSNGVNDINAFFSLIDFLDDACGGNYTEKLEEMSIGELAPIIEPYFTEFGKHLDAQVTVGE